MDFLRTYPFLICLIVMLCSEVTKHLFEGVYRGVWFDHGGIPSSHSAFVTSLLIVVERADGLQSTEFAIATVFAGIVWYDALFVRREVGKQAKMLNVMQQLEQFSERIGHSFMEVVAGILFGAILTPLLLFVF